MKNPSQTNHAKAERYAYAHGKYSRALSVGSYLEAITICESLLSDRLLVSCEQWFNETRGEDNKLSTGIRHLVKKHKCLAADEKVASANGQSTPDLISDLDAWIDERNELLHGIAKCLPGEELLSTASLDKRARAAAEKGLILFRQVDNWVRRHCEEERLRRNAS
jgi:hypothetical protein